MTEPTIHLLSEGRSLCDMAGPPKDWPDGHLFVSLEEPDPANCPKCLQAKISGKTNKEVIVFRIYHQMMGSHVHVKVFAGTWDNRESLGLSGRLVMRPEEWAALRDVLKETEPRREYTKMEIVDETPTRRYQKE